MRKKSLTIFLSPFTLSLIISVIVFLFLPKYNYKYEVKISKESLLSKDALLYYLDLNGDDLNEKISIRDYQAVPTVEIFEHSGAFINSWNQTGRRVCNFHLIHGDYDGNGLTELYVFTEENDSVFMNWIEPFKDENWNSSKLFICKLNKVSDGCDYMFTEGDLSDLNHDGKKEVVFLINQGFGLTPRALYAADVFNRKIYKSAVNYAAKKGPLYIADLDNDGADELIYQTGATGNTSIDSVLPYSDHSAWLMVHDNNLDFKFPPIEFKGDQKSISTVPVKFDGKYQLVSLLIDTRSTTTPLRLLVHSVQGRQLAEVDLEGIGSIHDLLTLFPVNTGSEQLIYVFNTQKGDVYVLNDRYELRLIKSFREKIDNIFADDFDQDGKMDFVFYKFDLKTICFADLEFNILAEAPLSRDLAYSEAHVGVKSIVNKNPLLYAQFGLELFTIELIPIPFYYEFLIFTGIYFGIFLIVLSAQKVQSVNLKQRKRVEDRISELQLKSTLSQLDPHFTFNVINAISSSILSDDKVKANDFLVEFSRLLRRSLEYSDKVSWSLEKELEFVDAYLKLQKSRFESMFDYKWETEEKVNLSVHIPKMIVQGYVENAIKHGLRPKGAGGLLKIVIRQDQKALHIEIKDNGIGRTASLQSKKTAGTGKGMILNAELLELYNKLTHSTIQVSIKDVTDSDNRALGTTVKLIIPKNA